MSHTTILNSYILIKPSKNICKYIQKLNSIPNIPPRIKLLISNSDIVYKNHQENSISCSLTSDDYSYIKSLQSELENEHSYELLTAAELNTFASNYSDGHFLRLEDLLWLNNYNRNERANNDKQYSLHEILNESSIYVPENEKIERNPELTKRCKKLKTQQDNLLYKSMTKNVDNVRVRHPEDTIAYQIKQFNKQLIAVFQFIVSVATGFVFGFIGIELMVGTLDFGFKLLLGIMCSLIIALAELYFLAKQLNES